VAYYEYGKHPVARTVASRATDKSSTTCPLRNFQSPALQQPIRLAISLRQPAPVSFFRKETGVHTTAAAQLVQGFAAFPFVTIGVTNTEVTSNSDADDGAAAHGMVCT